MKKYLSLLFIIVLLFAGCSSSENEIEPIEKVSRGIMNNLQIEIPENTPPLTKAIYEASDYAANVLISGKMKTKPEFIAFEFSNVPLSNEEKSTLMELYKVYGIEITEGRRSGLADIDRGITIGFGETTKYQREDCDLTVVVKIYYGKNCYNYCCDFKMQDNEYIMVDIENISRDWYIQ